MKKKLIIICTFLFALTFYLACNDKKDLNNGKNALALKQSTLSAHYLISSDSEDYVPLNVAETVAESFDETSFYASEQNTFRKFAKKVSGSQNSRQIKNSLTIKDSIGIPVMYVFNYTNNGGFLIVSADYNVQPILAYVNNGEFHLDSAKVPMPLVVWDNSTYQGIQNIRKLIKLNKTDSSQKTALNAMAKSLYKNSNVNFDSLKNYAESSKKLWDSYFTKNGMQLVKQDISKMVNGQVFRPDTDPPVECQPTQEWIYGPLLTTTWGQACSYNDSCPSKNCSICFGSDKAWTGCVATSVGQLIRFFQPQTQYNYNYAAMPSDYGNGEVQRLMRDIGLPENADMDYECDGSGADGGRVPGFLKSHFGFTTATRVDYEFSDVDEVANDLETGRPVLCEGYADKTNRFLGIIYSYDNGHEWVCDGYQYILIKDCEPPYQGWGYTYLHMNWGWHETSGGTDYNGWFNYGIWQPTPDENFAYKQHIVYKLGIN